MKMELSAHERSVAIKSLQRYAEENLAEPLGELSAGLLLSFMLHEIGPVVYNQAIADAQLLLQVRVADLSGELFEDAFQYWPKLEAKRRKRAS